MNTNDLFKAVMELDLDPIKAKLMHIESGEGWSKKKTDAVEKEYRRFLCLMKMYPDEDTAPLVDVDTFWHYHILDTMKYAQDCAQAFGYFLHHYPYVGMRGGDDDQFRIDSGERMRTLYETTFGEAYPDTQMAAPATVALDDSGSLVVDRRPLVDMAAGTAWCAGPGAKASAGRMNILAAWCAGPGAKASAAKRRDATAWCAGPGIKAGAAGGGNATAWCAGPGARDSAGKTGTAWCAGPGQRVSQPQHTSAILTA